MGLLLGNWFGGGHKPPKPKPPVVVTPVEPGVVEPPFYPPDIPPTIPSNMTEPVLIASGVNPIGMSYWRNINNHSGSDKLLVVLSVNNELVLFTIDKATLGVIYQQPLGINHTGEGVYFSAHESNILFIPINDTLLRFNVVTGEQLPVWISPAGTYLWQCHSDYYERVHSATLKDSNYNMIKWIVSTGQEYEISGEPDECQIDKSGTWLLIKEGNYNRIINLVNDSESIVKNEDGAVGHSDCGFGCVFGENDMSMYGGALDMIRYQDLHHELVFTTGIWNLGYFSFTNARPGDLTGQKGLITTPNDLIMVELDSNRGGKRICSNLTESQEYEHRPKANLCPFGQYAVWTAFVGGQIRAYLISVL